MPLPLERGGSITPGELVCNRIAEAYPWDESTGIIPFELRTYADMTIVDQRTIVESRNDVATDTELVAGFPLHIPIVSANMDTITGPEMAKRMAELGGLGVLHRTMTIPQMEEAIKQVKLAQEYVVYDVPRVLETDTSARAREVMQRYNRGFVVVYSEDGLWLGIVTPRDLRAAESDEVPVSHEGVMTRRDAVITRPSGIDVRQAEKIMREKKVEKLFLVNDEGEIVGVVADRNLRDIEANPYATRDPLGRLRLGVSVGIRDSGEATERAVAATQAGADIIFIDSAVGDSVLTDKVLEALAKKSGLPPIGIGNVANPKSVNSLITLFKKLFDNGVLVVKIGRSPGGACESRQVSAGVPQWSAIIYAADVASRYNDVRIMADGGIRRPIDVGLAIGAGADTVMVGSYIAGTRETPGEIRTDRQKGGLRYKVFRGSSSESARKDFDRLYGIDPTSRQAIVPEGLEEAHVLYTGQVDKKIYELAGGLRSAISQSQSTNIPQFQRRVVFGKQSSGGMVEGTPHVPRL